MSGLSCPLIQQVAFRDRHKAAAVFAIGSSEMQGLEGMLMKMVHHTPCDFAAEAHTGGVSTKQHSKERERQKSLMIFENLYFFQSGLWSGGSPAAT